MKRLFKWLDDLPPFAWVSVVFPAILAITPVVLVIAMWWWRFVFQFLPPVHQ